LRLTVPIRDETFLPLTFCRGRTVHFAPSDRSKPLLLKNFEGICLDAGAGTTELRRQNFSCRAFNSNTFGGAVISCVRPLNRHFFMTGRRLTDRIRVLCAKALDHGQDGWNATLNELQFAIQEHTLRLSNMSVAAWVPGQVISDRRKPEPSIPHSVRTLVAMHSAVHANRKAHGKKSRMSTTPSTMHYSRH